MSGLLDEPIAEGELLLFSAQHAHTPRVRVVWLRMRLRRADGTEVNVAVTMSTPGLADDLADAIDCKACRQKREDSKT